MQGHAEIIRDHQFLMADSVRKLQRKIGKSAFVLALIFIAWLPFGIFNIVPFVFTLPGEPSLRRE